MHKDEKMLVLTHDVEKVVVEGNCRQLVKAAVEVLKIKIVSPIYDVKDHKITLLLAILSWRWQTMVQCRDCASTLNS